LQTSDVLLSHAPLQFDLSFFDVFSALPSCAAVVLASASDVQSALRIAELVERRKVTVWQSVPSALTLQVLANQRLGRRLSSVRAVLFAGEVMPRSTLAELPSLFPHARFYNVYGCTETNDTFVYPLPQEVASAPEPLPIGMPLSYVKHRVVGQDGLDVRAGDVGELWVAGPTVMAGYLGEARGSQLEDGAESVPYYRTRDLVSQGHDGCTCFHGRADGVVKVNGHRVSLVEIERTLRMFDEVDDAAVVAIHPRDGGARLAAAVTLHAEAAATTLSLRRFCAANLPPYAVPQTFEIVPELPRGATGKVDRALIERRFIVAATHSTGDNS
jgi:acyl-coenzyme A synthetase/AMP-(fatty) acid ligase